MIDQEISREKISIAASYLRSAFAGRKPRLGLILGSGLGPLADCFEDAVSVDFSQVPYMGSSSVPGHEGRFVCGTFEGVEAIALKGRLHGYEGYTSQEVAFPVWVLNALGVTTLITTNAAGAINESYQVGDFCIISDHINFTGRNPIAGTEPDKLAPRFFSMLDAYDPQLRSLALYVARMAGINAHEGVLLSLYGPSFETPTEIRAFRAWGADTVAMSLVEEVIAARHVDMRVLGISLISNMACGIDGANPADDDMLEVARTSEQDFLALMRGIVRELD